MSRIIQLGEHQWQLPPEPKSREDVLFAKEKKENQYWRRQTDFPKFFYDWDSETKLWQEHTIYGDGGVLISLDRNDSKSLIHYREREMKRRCLGVWFMNNGELTYLTGGHYFFLQWCQMPGGNEENGTSYGNYREFQAHLAYFMQMVKEDDDCLGAYILKPKKTGVTQFFASDFVEESTRIGGKWFGMMSKVQVPDCRDNNFMMYKHCLENLPNIMKPSIANENLTMIFYGNPVNNKNSSRKTRARANGNLSWMNTRVTCLPTKDNAFDGGKPYRAWLDEFPKYEDPYPEEVFKKTAPAVRMGRLVTGKMWITSYTPETDNKSYEQAKKVFYESLLETKNKDTRRTKSEIYAYFISVLDANEGSFDKYGKTDRAANEVWVNQQLEQKKGDQAAIQAFNRQYPRTIDEAWRAGGRGGSVFNNARLGEKSLRITKELAVGQLRYKEANLSWSGKHQKSAVKIDIITEKQKLDNEFGVWRMWDMDTWRMDCFNKVFHNDTRDQDGKLMPDKEIRYVIGMDPTNYRHSSDVGEGSKNSIWVHALPDPVLNSYFKKQVSDRPVASFLYRHEKPSETYDEIKKAIYMWGCPIIIEGNMPTWCSLLIEDGLENFLLVYDTKTKAIVPYNATEHKTLPSTQGSRDAGTINELIKEAQEYLGVPAPGKPDNLENINCEILLKQLMELDPTNTKKSDHAMGWMWTLLAARSMNAYITRMLERLQDYSVETMGAALGAFD